MTKGCKIWLWISFVGRCISILTGLSLLGNDAGLAIMALIEGAIELTGISLLLFKLKKEGYYLLVGGAVIAFFYNVTSGTNFIIALIVSALSPLITYYFLNKSGIIGSNTLPQGTPISSTFSSSSTVQTTFNNGNNTAEYTSSGASQTQESNYTGKSATNTESFNSNAQKGNASFGNFNTAKSNLNITVDLYKELAIERSWDIKTIRKQLRELQKQWIRRQSACNDKEQLLLIDKILNYIEDGFKYLTKEEKKAQYDVALEQAYKSGIIIDVAEEKLITLLDQARAYYRKGNIQFAAKCAQEAVDGNINDPNAYEFLAQCYNMLGKYNEAIGVVDKGLSIFNNHLQLTWLGARISTDGLQDFASAQSRINQLIEIAPDNSIGHSEQVYMHLRKADENLAFQEIDNYIASHPEDNEFKKNVAYDLDVYSNNCFYHDAATDSYFIADKAAYDKCIRLRTKACEIFLDEHTQNRLERAQYYGQKEFFDWNWDSIKGLAITGTIFAVMGMASGAFMGIALILYACMGALIYYSFRPYWQINKTYVTGELGTAEQVANMMGPVVVKGARLLLKATFKIMELIIKFALYLASGRLFR